MPPDFAPSSPRVGLLFDSVSPNTGDIAIGIAAQQELARNGIDDVVVLDPFAPDVSAVDAVLVGGGELIRPTGDAFYDAFRLPRGTVLNAVGVWQSADELSFLDDYEWVAARSSAEAEVLRRQRPDADVLACTTTTLESEPVAIPGVEPGEPVVGIHVVPHTLVLCPDLVEVIDGIQGKKVLIPFTHYNYDDSFMRALPLDRSNVVMLPRMTPLELHAVIGQMSYVVTSSLHASLFAYSQNVPFASAYQEKVWNYFVDRGLERFIFRNGADLRRALVEIAGGHVDFRDQVERDKAQVRAAYGRYAEAFRRRAGQRRDTAPGAADAPAAVASAPGSDLARELLLSGQRENVILHRDNVIHGLMLRALTAEHDVAVWRAEAERLSARLRAFDLRQRWRR